MSGQVANGSNKNNGKSVNIGLVIICIIAIVVIAVLVGIIINIKSSEEPQNAEEESKRPVVVVEENAEEVAEQILNKPEPEDVPLQYQVTMNSIWNFESGDVASENAYVENAENNETSVYFDVIRNDTQEVIYRSPVIPIGEHLDNIVLDTGLSAGSYECTLTYHLIDDDQNTLTTVNMWLQINIKN